MPGLIDYLPTADVLLELEPEDLGAILLAIVSQPPGSVRGLFAWGAIIQHLGKIIPAQKEES